MSDKLRFALCVGFAIVRKSRRAADYLTERDARRGARTNPPSIRSFKAIHRRAAPRSGRNLSPFSPRSPRVL